jgi:8-oxo-dGTP pyrophosphatase MutT (NUDIX family)
VTYKRRSARVIVVDEQFHVLLFQFYLNPKKRDEGQFWITPGGGVDKGEELVHAAARELREETGFAVAPEELLYVGHAEGYAKFDWAKGMFRDDYYFWRAATRELDESMQEEWERSQITGHRWWSVEELVVTQERVIPPGLAGLLMQLSDGSHQAPRQLEWHH